MEAASVDRRQRRFSLCVSPANVAKDQRPGAAVPLNCHQGGVDKAAAVTESFLMLLYFVLCREKRRGTLQQDRRVMHVSVHEAGHGWLLLAES